MNDKQGTAHASGTRTAKRTLMRLSLIHIYGMIDFVGEIKNLTDADVDSVCVNVLLRDAGGAIVAGYSGYVDNLAAGATTSFELSLIHI